MLKSLQFVFYIKDVPNTWIFEHYLNLHGKLTGGNLVIKSIFNNEKTPSMSIYFKDGEYKFKDFSSSYGGTGIDLVMHMYHLSYTQAVDRILRDYEKYLQSGNKYETPELTIEDKYKVKEYVTRPWNEADANYWLQFGINSKILEHFNVMPLKSFTMAKGSEEITINRNCTYGYFTKDKELYKIYQPGNKSKKFIKVKDYIQGSDQLQNCKYLVICSSLKDAMAFKALGFKGVDVIAPDSENTIIPKEYIEKMKAKYLKVCTLLDNDSPGLKAMINYQELYGLPYVHLNLEKDLADSVRDHGVRNTAIYLFPLLTKVLTGTAKHI